MAAPLNVIPCLADKLAEGIVDLDVRPARILIPDEIRYHIDRRLKIIPAKQMLLLLTHLHLQMMHVKPQQHRPQRLCPDSSQTAELFRCFLSRIPAAKNALDAIGPQLPQHRKGYGKRFIKNKNIQFFLQQRRFILYNRVLMFKPIQRNRPCQKRTDL